MGMWLRRTVRGDAPMQVQIGDHAAGNELLADKILHQPDRFGLAQLTRQRDLDLARQLAFALRAIPHLAGRHLVPQRLAIAPAVRRADGQHDLGMHDAGLCQIVLRAADLGIEQCRARAVGRRGDDAPALAAADDLALEVVDRHLGAFCLVGAAYHRPAGALKHAQAKATLLYKRAFADLLRSTPQANDAARAAVLAAIPSSSTVAARAGQTGTARARQALPFCSPAQTDLRHRLQIPRPSFRDDPAHHSGMMPPGFGLLAV
jgi:hypothetical protein